jgi:hypothetical protein
MEIVPKSKRRGALANANNTTPVECHKVAKLQKKVNAG